MIRTKYVGTETFMEFYLLYCLGGLAIKLIYASTPHNSTVGFFKGPKLNFFSDIVWFANNVLPFLNAFSFHRPWLTKARAH